MNYFPKTFIFFHTRKLLRLANNTIFSLLIMCTLTFIPQAFSSPSKTQAITNILVLGDSLSAAYNIPLEKGWVNLLRKRVPGIEIINASLGGATTSNGLQRLPGLLEKHKSQLVIIELGANDGLQGKPIHYITSNLDKLIIFAQSTGAKVLLIGNRLPPNRGERYTKPFFNQYQKLAKRHSVAYLPFMLRGLAGNSEYMQQDGLHPKANAQAAILDNLWPILKPLLAL